MNHSSGLETEPPSILPGRSGPVAVHAVLFGGEAPELDNGALHGRARIERGIRFSEDPAAASRGRRVPVAWVATPADDTPEAYLGAVAGDFWIDAASGTGFKKLSAHTNGICAAAGGKVDVAALSPDQRRALAALLERLSPSAWAATAPLFKLFLSS